MVLTFYGKEEATVTINFVTHLDCKPCEFLTWLSQSAASNPWTLSIVCGWHGTTTINGKQVKGGGATNDLIYVGEVYRGDN